MARDSRHCRKAVASCRFGARTARSRASGCPSPSIDQYSSAKSVCSRICPCAATVRNTDAIGSVRREAAMRELRLYVIDGDEPAGRWRIVDRTSLEVADGEVWVTIEGLPDDHWQRRGFADADARHARMGQRGVAGRDVCVRSARGACEARRAGVVEAARRVARRPASRARVVADVAFPGREQRSVRALFERTCDPAGRVVMRRSA